MEKVHVKAFIVSEVAGLPATWLGNARQYNHYWRILFTFHKHLFQGRPLNGYSCLYFVVSVIKGHYHLVNRKFLFTKDISVMNVFFLGFTKASLQKTFQVKIFPSKNIIQVKKTTFLPSFQNSIWIIMRLTRFMSLPSFFLYPLKTSEKTIVFLYFQGVWKRSVASRKLLREFTLREKCPNTEFFIVRIFLYSDWIRRFTE